MFFSRFIVKAVISAPDVSPGLNQMCAVVSSMSGMTMLIRIKEDVKYLHQLVLHFTQITETSEKYKEDMSLGRVSHKAT